MAKMRFTAAQSASVADEMRRLHDEAVKDIELKKQFYDEAHRLREVLVAYEAWEADVILENECWTGQNLRLTDELYDRMIELQEMRNAVLYPPLAHGASSEVVDDREVAEANTEGALNQS